MKRRKTVIAQKGDVRRDRREGARCKGIKSEGEGGLVPGRRKLEGKVRVVPRMGPNPLDQY